MLPFLLRFDTNYEYHVSLSHSDSHVVLTNSHKLSNIKALYVDKYRK